MCSRGMDQQFCQSAAAITELRNSNSNSSTHSNSSSQEANSAVEQQELDKQQSALKYQIMKASELASSGNISVFYKQRSPGKLKPEFVPILPNKSTTSNSSVEDQSSHQKVSQQSCVDSKAVATTPITFANRPGASHVTNNQLVTSSTSATAGKHQTDITEEASLQARLEQKKALTVTQVNKPVLPKPIQANHQQPKLVRTPVQAKSPQSPNQKAIQPQQVKSPTVQQQAKPIVQPAKTNLSTVQSKPNIPLIQGIKAIVQSPKPQLTTVQSTKHLTVQFKPNQIGVRLKQPIQQEIFQGKAIQTTKNKPQQSTSPVQLKTQVQTKQQSSSQNQFHVQPVQQVIKPTQITLSKQFVQTNAQLKTFQQSPTPQLSKSIQLTATSVNSSATSVSPGPQHQRTLQTAATTFTVTSNSKRPNTSPANSATPAKRSALSQDNERNHLAPPSSLAERCRKSYPSTKKKSKVVPLTDADINKVGQFKLPSQVSAQPMQQVKQLNLQNQPKAVFQLKPTQQQQQQFHQPSLVSIPLPTVLSSPLPPVTAAVLPAGISQAITLITNQNKIATVTTPNSTETPQSNTSVEKQTNESFQSLPARPENNRSYKIVLMIDDKTMMFNMDGSGQQIAEALQKVQAGCNEEVERAITESILRQVTPSKQQQQQQQQQQQEIDTKSAQGLQQLLQSQTMEKDDEADDASPQSSQSPSPSPSKAETANYDGKMALCHHCGFSSPSYDQCTRCKTKLPPDVKSICLNPVSVVLPEFQSNLLVKRTNEVAVAVADSPKKRQKAGKRKKVEEPVREYCYELNRKLKKTGSLRPGSLRRHDRNLLTLENIESNPRFFGEVCLTISSDDEDANDSRCNNVKLSACTDDPSAAVHQDPAITQSAMQKEPVITDEEEESIKDGEYQDPMEREMCEQIGAMEGELENLMNGRDADSEWPVALDCRTVRIGSYKVVPVDSVYITIPGIFITIPAIIAYESVQIIIPWDCIVKILAHFGKGMPVLFLYTTSSMGAKIRKMLGMTDKNNFPYYDPASANESQRRITLLPENISVECSSILKKLFANLERTEYEELSQNEANDILVRASPKEVQNQVQKAVVSTPRLPNDIQTIMVYPPPPAKGGMPINTEDYACLGEDQFLNDVIIDFYLKYIHQHFLSEKDQARTHILSTFFYKRLTMKPTGSRRSHNPVENDPKATAAEKRHSRVKSWTKSVDIFKKDFIIIPINEHSHWFLAVVCFPGLTGPVDFATNQPIAVPDSKAKTKQHSAEKDIDSKSVMAGKTSMTIGSTTITAVSTSPTQQLQAPADTVTLLQPEEEDRDEADGDDDEFEQTSSEEEQDTENAAVKIEIEENKEPEQSPEETIKETPEAVVEQKSKRSRKKEPRMPIKQPCILIFDSLATASRAKVVATLRDYLKIEYKVKHGVERSFTKEFMKGASPKVPQQTNYTDCGLYVLQYVEAFFQVPITDYHIPMKMLQEWFDVELVSRKRFDIQQLLHKLMAEQGIDFSTLNLPELNLAPFQHGLVDYPSSDEMMGEEEDDEYQAYGEAYQAMCEDARFNGYRDGEGRLEDEDEEEEEDDEENEDEEQMGVEGMIVDEEMGCEGEEEEEELDEEEEDGDEEEDEDCVGGKVCDNMDNELLDEVVPKIKPALKAFRIPRLKQQQLHHREELQLSQSHAVTFIRTRLISDNNCDSQSTSDEN